MSAANTLVPELRFPEFQKDKEWLSSSLGQLGEIVTGKTPSTKDLDLWNGEIPFITPTDISENSKYQYTTQRSVARTKNTKTVPSGSIVYTCIASIGKMAVTSCESLTNQQINSVIVRKQHSSDFVYYSLLYQTPRIKNTPASSTLPIINKTEFSKLLVPKPDLPEQQKIADCLGSLDDLICAHNAKLDALQVYKKGLLQQLFPAEGETTPKLRFPGFEGEWDGVALGTIFIFKQGLQVAVDKQFLNQGNDRERFIRIIDVTQSNEPPRFIKVTNDAQVISKKDLFMIRYGTPGIVSIGYEGVIANNLFQLIFKSENDHFPSFWYYYFQAKYGEISNLSGSSSMPAISFKTLNNLRAVYTSLPEQQKIADCLSALDALITAQTEQIAALKAHKKGLMQKLFPIG